MPSCVTCAGKINQNAVTLLGDWRSGSAAALHADGRWFKSDISHLCIYNNMKDKKFKKLIQKPLRFHHQDIHEELDEIKRMIQDVSSTLQNLQYRIEQPSNTD